jgi:hypothetical protein
LASVALSAGSGHRCRVALPRQFSAILAVSGSLLMINGYFLIVHLPFE